jgi:hypothetical protein
MRLASMTFVLILSRIRNSSNFRFARVDKAASRVVIKIRFVIFQRYKSFSLCCGVDSISKFDSINEQKDCEFP